MKNKLLHIATAVALFSCANLSAQAPALGSTANYVLFTSIGAVTNNGISQLTGNVGTNNGLCTAFGNVNGQMHSQDGSTSLCSTDLLIAYNQLNAAVPTMFPAPALGSQTLSAAIYSISGNTTLNQTLVLDGGGNANSVFIFQISGAFSANAGSQVTLINNAKACNVFWKVEGVVSLASGTKMRGTIIANNAAINMSTGVTLEGRALSTSGAVSVNGTFAYTPIGCGSPTLTGPAAPALASTACYALFSGNGSLTNTGNTYATGDVGTNVGLTTGFNALNVTGTIHPIPDGSTGQCATDLLNVYNYLNTLPFDIELLYPAQFGKSLVLTPHTYAMNGATMFNDTLFLNGGGNANAVFVIQANGALSTGVYANVVLTNGTQAKNVFWKVDGALNINNFSTFKGTVVCNNGAVSLNKGSKIDGRVFTTNGAFSTDSINIVMPAGCAVSVGINTTKASGSEGMVSFYPNPFTTSISVKIDNASEINSSEMRLYNVLGTLVAKVIITEKTTVLDLNLPSGVYFYKVVNKSNGIQSGKIVSQQQ